MTTQSKSAQSREFPITPFDNADFGTIHTIEIDGEPWFIASDVARVLEYSHTPHLLRLLPGDERSVHIVDRTGTLGGNPQIGIISEPGLYRAIFASRSERAEPFKRWVCHEILPTIRRQGYYALPGTAIGILPPQIFRKALHGRPACLGSTLWACLQVKMSLTEWLPMRLERFSLGLDYEWLTDGGDALITRATAEEIAARSWTPGARKLRYVWGESVCGEGEALGGAA